MISALRWVVDLNGAANLSASLNDDTVKDFEACLIYSVQAKMIPRRHVGGADQYMRKFAKVYPVDSGRLLMVCKFYEEYWYSRVILESTCSNIGIQYDDVVAE